MWSGRLPSDDCFINFICVNLEKKKNSSFLSTESDDYYYYTVAYASIGCRADWES